MVQTNMRQDSASAPKSALQRLEELVNDTIIVNQHTTGVRYNATAEINCYLAASRAQKDSDLLIWWCMFKKDFPALAALACNYFAAPASSVPCEQLFSIAGNTITKNCNSLAPETAQALLCSRSWSLLLGI